MSERLKSTTIHLPATVFAEIDALADRLPPMPGAKFSRNGWIAQAICDALDATRARAAATPTPGASR